MVKLSRKALNAAMLTQGINVAMLARGSNVNQNTIARYLRSGGNIRHDTAFNLATALGVSPFDLIEETGGAGDDDCRRVYHAGKATRKEKKIENFGSKA